MKLQRFYVALRITMGTKPLRTPSLELVNQLKRVLRMSPGDDVILFDGSGSEFRAQIQEIGNDFVSFNILKELDNTTQSSRETWLLTSVVKKDNFEWIVEKATELGVTHIVPIVSSRTEKKDINIERLNKIIIESSEQSSRVSLPTLHEVMSLEESLNKFKEIKSIAWEPTAKKFSSDDLKNISGMYVGPEGGWTKEELELFEKNGIATLSLGQQILRAETAVIAGLSQIVF